MKRFLGAFALCLGILLSTVTAEAQNAAAPRVLVFYSLNVENDHVLFALDALRFYAELAEKDNFALEATTNLEDFNDKTTRWPWFMQFIGGGVFDANSWPPLPAVLRVDDRNSPVTDGLPETFLAPTNEWYRWKPSPRDDSHIHVLVTLDPSNYPLGIKGLLTFGDIPVVWTNTQYKMVYMNMGHGDKIFTSPVQNTLIKNATEWLLGKT